MMFLANLGSTLILTGLIWIIQVVHYPSFHFIEKSNFLNFSSFHQLNISFVVMPLMLVELFTGLALVIGNPDESMAYVLLLFILLIWGSTFFLSVPIHSYLSEYGYDFEMVNKLILTNWPRTILWSARSVMLLWLVRKYV